MKLQVLRTTAAAAFLIFAVQPGLTQEAGAFTPPPSGPFKFLPSVADVGPSPVPTPVQVPTAPAATGGNAAVAAPQWRAPQQQALPWWMQDGATQGMPTASNRPAAASVPTTPATPLAAQSGRYGTGTTPGFYPGYGGGQFGQGQVGGGATVGASGTAGGQASVAAGQGARAAQQPYQGFQPYQPYQPYGAPMPYWGQPGVPVAPIQVAPQPYGGWPGYAVPQPYPYPAWPGTAQTQGARQ